MAQSRRAFPITPTSAAPFIPRLDGSVGSSNSLAGVHSISDRFHLSADPHYWGSNLSRDVPEPDDALHNPEVRGGKYYDGGNNGLSARGIANIGCLLVLGCGLLTLFIGYPLISYFREKTMSNLGGFNLGGVNASGQVPEMGNWGLIDLDTPKSAYTKSSVSEDGVELQLVFSDEFNVDGRTFYPGDDPYWEAHDLHYWGTNNMEWYDPAAITTVGGHLQVTLREKETHGLHYEGGLMSTWNKMCFTGGLIETSVMLPGINNVEGLWPAVWTLGNLGRAGYGATLDGLWPYTYDACDVGTLPNQTLNGLPVAATTGGAEKDNYALSYLPGQRLSRCTCAGESHPGPVHSDGTYVGRSAPEIDVIEAQVTGDPLQGQVSQSGQWAPFNDRYVWHNTSENLIIYDETLAHLNSYIGGNTQQAGSVVVTTDQDCYQLRTGCFSIYGFEYKPGFDDAYITWISDNKMSWRVNAAGMGPDTGTEISARPIPQEPMYIIINLGMSKNFGAVDLEHLTFPATMLVDYVRVYQHPDRMSVTCDPPEFPTAAYIETYIEAYSNPNLTTWVDDFKQTIPKNSLIDQC